MTVQKTEPVETTNEILGADEDPFAGGIGGVATEDVFNEYGGAVEEPTKASKKTKESKPKATKTEQAKKILQMLKKNLMKQQETSLIFLKMIL